jgi:hypothetical protein
VIGRFDSVTDQPAIMAVPVLALNAVNGLVRLITIMVTAIAIIDR